MKTFIPIFRVVSLLLCAVQVHAEDETHEQIANLTVEVIDAARPEPGVGKAGQELAKKLAEHDHAKVVEAMLPLLKHEQKGVPYLASYVILECKNGLRPEHLDQLKEGFHHGGGWLPNAIRNLGIDAAAEFLVKEFRANPELYGQLDGAIMRMGEQAVPFLMKEFDEADIEQEQNFAGL